MPPHKYQYNRAPDRPNSSNIEQVRYAQDLDEALKVLKQERATSKVRTPAPVTLPEVKGWWPIPEEER